MGPTIGAVAEALRQTGRRPRLTVAITFLGWLLAIATGAGLWGLIHFGRGRVSVPLLTLLVVGLTGGSLALGNAVLVAVVGGERGTPAGDPLEALRTGLRDHLGDAGRASLLLVVLVLPAMVTAGLLAAALVPNAFLRTSHGAGTGVTALAYLMTFEPSSAAVLATVLLGDWVAPNAVHATVATFTLLALVPARFTDVAGLTAGDSLGVLDSFNTVSAHPLGALGYALGRLALLGTAVAFVAIGWSAGAGGDGAHLGVVVASAPAAVVAFPVLYRFHFAWYERARPSA